MKIHLKDERVADKEDIFEFEGGLKSFVEFLNEGKNALNEVFHFNAEREDGMAVEVASNGTTASRKAFTATPTTFHSAMAVPT